MHLLSELGLHESFLDCVEQHRPGGLSMALNRGGQSELVPVEHLVPEVTRAKQRIAELTVEIAKFRRGPLPKAKAPILKDRINKISMINRISPNSCHAFSQTTLSLCRAYGTPIGEIL
jgi:hypothetical protein